MSFLISIVTLCGWKLMECELVFLMGQMLVYSVLALDESYG